MENTKNNFEKFVANYWGQNIANYAGVDNAEINMNTICHIQSLNLTPLHLITDEDAIEVGILTGCWTRKEALECGSEINDQLIKFGHIFCKGIGKEYGLGLTAPFAGTIQDISDAFDYLRSKGYALPFNGLSVDQQISYGWVVLKTKI